jgi:hypothetical protein
LEWGGSTIIAIAVPMNAALTRLATALNKSNYFASWNVNSIFDHSINRMCCDFLVGFPSIYRMEVK